MSAHDVLIVGAGLAGLSCALELQSQGARVGILEASNGVGGRLRTDRVDGFLLDRGFQVLLDSYPEATRLIDLGALDPHPFEPGALIRRAGRFHWMGDPFRQPGDLLRTLGTPIGNLSDKLRLGLMRRRIMRRALDDTVSGGDTSTLRTLLDEGFSASMIDAFFRPFFGGVFLTTSLGTSSRAFEFTFRMFALGEAVLPASGMEAIPAQLAARLPSGTVRLNAPVESIDGRTLRLRSGERLTAGAIVLAVEAPAAERLLGRRPETASMGVTCLYFATPEPPVRGPKLILNGEGDGPVNNLCVPSEVCPTYAPDGMALISATVLGVPERDGLDLETAVRAQMTGWFGDAVERWRHLRTYRIRHALPAQPAGIAADVSTRRSRPSPAVYRCGDDFGIASINGALLSGRRIAGMVLQGASS